MKIGRWYILIAKFIVDMLGRMFTLCLGLVLVLASLADTYFTIIDGKITISWTWPFLHLVQPIEIRDVVYPIFFLLLGFWIITLIFVLESQENDTEE